MTVLSQDSPQGNRRNTHDPGSVVVRQVGNPTNALSVAMQLGAPSHDALADIACQAGVTVRQAALARAGKPINAGAYLALCGVAGVDPIDGSPRQIKTVSPNVVWWQLSGALYITRGLRRLDQRSAAKLIGVSPSTVCRVEAGQPVSVANMIKVCAFVGVHPDGYTAPLNSPCRSVSRGTPTETRCSDLDLRRGGAAHA
jgi:DNA-binding XRE family transcriptional regulator